MSNTHRLQIAYYCSKDPLDKRSWSGITYYLGKSLEKNIGDVQYIGPLKFPWVLEAVLHAIQKINKILFKKVWAPNFSLVKNFYAAHYLNHKMNKGHYDLVFAPAAGSELAYLNTSIPILYFNDATFKIYTDSYEEFKKLSTFSKWEGNYLERKSLKKSRVVVAASKWAADSVTKDYGIPSQNVEVLLMGANMDYVPDRSLIFKKLEIPVLTMLFLGVDWERKGGDIAFDTLTELHKRGLPAKLIVCGVTPPLECSHPSMEVIPFLNKNEKKDHDHFIDLLSSVHFLLMPTRADCSSLVNNEANAFGVPTISTDVGGVCDVVQNGINGYCLPLTATGKDYATIIEKIFTNREEYFQLVSSSRKRFEEVLNWDHFAKGLKEIIQKHNLFTFN